jgi:hypothetical protein
VNLALSADTDTHSITWQFIGGSSFNLLEVHVSIVQKFNSRCLV